MSEQARNEVDYQRPAVQDTVDVTALLTQNKPGKSGGGGS